MDFYPFKVCIHSSQPFFSHMYVRPKPSELADNEKQSRAVFITGLPRSLADKSALGAVFGRHGAIQSIVVHPSQLSAVIAFMDQASVRSLLEAQKQTICMPSGESAPVPLEGVKGEKLQQSACPGKWADEASRHAEWMLHHRSKSPGNQLLRDQVDQWMEAFEHCEQAAASTSTVGDDGWTVVTRKPGRHKAKDAAEATAVSGISKAVAEAKRKKEPVKLLENFYRHQKWQKEASDLLSLKAKFEADKKKVAAMKAARRFRPN